MAELQYPVKCNHGKGVRIHRLAKGYPKQQALADAMKMPQSTLSDYERSPVLKDDVIKKFADFFGIDENTIRYFPDNDEKSGDIIFENNNFENGSNPIITNATGSISEQNNYNNPIEALMQLCKEKEQLLLASLEIERKKNEEFAKLQAEIEELRKEIAKR